MANIDKKKFVSSAIWKMLESFGSKGISMVISIILARLLMPENYGVIALTSIFINLSNFVVQSGLGTALVRKKDVDNVDYTTVFVFCMGIAALCYIVFFIASPFIAAFYNEPQITAVLRVQMLSLFLCALGVVRGAMITRQFRFRASFVTNMIATVISGICGIIMAYMGFGVWALVFHTLIRDGLGSLILFFFVKWTPSRHLSFKRMKSLLTFSSWVLTSSLLDFLANNIPGTIYGKHYSVTTLGYSTKGNQLPELLCLHTFGSITGVLLPTLAESQNDHQRFMDITRKIVTMSAYILMPMMAGLALLGNRVVIFLFTEKWLPCVPLMVASCIYYGVNPFRSINVQILYALGHAKKVATIEILRFCMLMANMVLSVFVFHLDFYTVSFIGSGIAIMVALITQLFVRPLIGYSFKMWLKDLSNPFLLTVCMSIPVFFAGKLPLGNTLTMFIQLFLGVAVYLTVSIITKSQSFLDILAILKGAIKK